MFDNLKIKWISFLKIPNSYQIVEEKHIFEEYFVEKHRYNFFPIDIIQIFDSFGYSLLSSRLDCYNMSFNFRKLKKTNLKKNITYNNNFSLKKEFIYNYYAKKKVTESKFNKICISLKKKYKNEKIKVFGGGRIFNLFIKHGLDNVNMILFLIIIYMTKLNIWGEKISKYKNNCNKI